MLRCRRCRKGIVDSSRLLTVEAIGDSSVAACSIWHVDAHALPEWILTTVQQAQWTAGKLNCQSCTARLGGFNFLNRGECPCGRDAAVRLSKSRVERDPKHRVLVVQPGGRTRPEQGRAAPPTIGFRGQAKQRPEFSRSAPDASQLNDRAAGVSRSSGPAEASSSLADRETAQAFSFTPLYCMAHGRRRSLEDDDDAAVRSSCFCPAGPTDRSAAEATRAGTYKPPRPPVPHPAGGQFDGEALAHAVVHQFIFPARTGPLLDRQLPRTARDVASCPEAVGVHEEASGSALFLGGRSISGGVAEQGMVPPASNRLSKRERNRLKSVRRKQRRRERWLHSQLEQAESGSASLLDGDEEEEEEEDREGLTCAVCLDVYLHPYRCHPCGHVFCEPCLRTIARNRPADTPCPLCRTLISHTNLHIELNQTAQTSFPSVYDARRQAFQSASCSQWPLPRCPERFRTFWGERRQAVMAGRRWRFARGGFTAGAPDLADVRGWLFDAGLVTICGHSVDWIPAALLLGFLAYYFLF